MKTEQRLLALRLIVLVALTISAGLLVEEWAPAAGLCGREGGCHEVLESAWARPLGVPLPALGLLLFAGLFGLSLASGRWAALLCRGLALAGGLGGLGLLLVQAALLRRFCPFCLVLDLASLGAAVLVLSLPAALPGVRRPAGLVWLGAAVVATAGAAGAWDAAWLAARPAGPPPPEVLALRHPSRITIVEVIDPDCRPCRHMHGRLNLLESELGDQVYRVCLVWRRRGSELPRDRARALFCARRQRQERGMARALAVAEVPGPALYRQAARLLHLSQPEFEACLADPKTDYELDRENAWLGSVREQGLPAVWIGDELLRGVYSLDDLREAFRKARRLARSEP